MNKTLNELRSEREKSIRDSDWILYRKLTSDIINKIHEEDINEH